MVRTSHSVSKRYLFSSLREPNVKFEEQNRRNPRNTISIVHFLQTRLFTENFHERLLSIRVFSAAGRAQWADSVSPRMNTIASRDQFKPIRTGKNLVVNMKCIKTFNCPDS